ncbi:hypothetical protein [Wenjunlia tyrosinilytica]|uniref:Uncharacterized protein n=1 Tax=Wenjunlia tyrosinilytica TaxID=1544741 RepID=A0A918E2G7_9ACTN|nr:hypothetical protein [Wenjunlia tyrosinilytica]GGO99339.1 hypothetical protein GCM10012280_65570 [Wenjunlia tyrosinilytica]
MHHSHRPAHRAARTYAEGRSPLRVLEETFFALAAAATPLTLPAHLVCEEPDSAALPVDQFRTRLAHPATAPVLRERTWREVVRRAQQLGEPWGTVAVAMSVPVLRRMLARLARPAHLEREEVEQEALAAVAVAVRTVDVNTADVGRELFSAADRAVHRLVYAARRQGARESGPMAAHVGRLAHPAVPAGCQDVAESADDGGEGDEYAVLARAVRAHVVDVAEARLIARTRLGGEPMRRLAAERGVSVRQLYRHRATAEQHLAAHLKGRRLEQ